jgi:hypothetical protein
MLRPSTIYEDRLWGFRWQYYGIPFEKVQSPPEVGETFDFLNMWSFLEDSYDKLLPTDKEKVDKETGREDVRFFVWTSKPHPRCCKTRERKVS